MFKIKICKKCKVEKEIIHFDIYPPSIKTRDGRQARCRECLQESRREKYLKDKKQKDFKEKARLYYSKNIDQYKSRYQEQKNDIWAYRILKNYNLTVEEYEAMMQEQEYSCAICYKFSDKLVVDHDHSCCPGSKSCGQCVRGLLCTQCNSGIGFLKDNEFILYSAIDYINS